jgi:hypothetical protein
MAAQAAAGEAQDARTAAPPPDEPDWLAEGTAAHGKACLPNLACCSIASHGEAGGNAMHCAACTVPNKSARSLLLRKCRLICA